MKPLLVVLDLDETLIYATTAKLPREPDFQVFHYFVYKRPYVDDFLKNCATHFQLAVWSSASDDYVQEIAANLFPPEIPLQFVWGRSKCLSKYAVKDVEDFFYIGDHKEYIKPLKKVWKLGYAKERIIVVDDTPSKSKLNYGNAIYPSEFVGQKVDDELPRLFAYLLKMKEVENVRTIEKRGWRSEVSA
ncbi:MAG: NIF family HAD-type phosphatase [Bacteroidia bacterium]